MCALMLLNMLNQAKPEESLKMEAEVEKKLRITVLSIFVLKVVKG